MRIRRIAILIDGGFYLKRLKHIVPESHRCSPEKVASTTAYYTRNIVKYLTPRSDDRNHWREHVYRFFFYDALPYDATAHNPLSNCQIKFSETDEYKFRHSLFEELRKRRNFALRLGKVEKEGDWTPSDPKTTKKLLRIKHFLDKFDSESLKFPNLSSSEKREWKNCLKIWQKLQPSGIKPGFRQKGVDMRIGVDITSLTLKNHVDTIVLCTGDSDFVPAAKLARREGIEFLLDPLGQSIKEDLNEHIDGTVSGFPPLEKLLQQSRPEED